MSYQDDVTQAFARTGPLFDKQDLTGPHHVGVEVDVELQIEHTVFWQRASDRLACLSGGFLAISIWGALNDSDLAIGTGMVGSIGASVASVLSLMQSKSISSYAVTDAPPILKAQIGPTGGWWPVVGTLPDGTVGPSRYKGETFTVRRHTSPR